MDDAVDGQFDGDFWHSQNAPQVIGADPTETRLGGFFFKTFKPASPDRLGVAGSEDLHVLRSTFLKRLVPGNCSYQCNALGSFVGQ